MKRCQENLATKFKHTVYWHCSVIRFLEKEVDVDDTIATLSRKNDEQVAYADPHFVHIDITPAVS